MKKNWIWAIVILVLLAIIETIIRKYYDIWSGTGLILSLVIGIPLLIIAFILIFKYIPKSRKEMKTFKYEGIFNPMWGMIIFLIISTAWTISYAVGYKVIPIPVIVIGWLVTIFYFVYWIKVRKH